MKTSTLFWIIGGFIALAVVGGAALTPPGAAPDIVRAFSNAIATAEGFFVNGSRPQRNNNPGDIMVNGQFVVYSSSSEGWDALYSMVYKWFYGGSVLYNPFMTIGQIAQIYVDGPNATGMSPGASAWAANVANYLGVSTSTTLNNLMGA